MKLLAKSDRKSAFTLVELLVVIAIVTVLIALLLPALNRARKQALLIVCESNMRQLSTAFMQYEIDFNGYTPMGVPPTGTTVDSGWINNFQQLHYIATDNKTHFAGKDCFFCPADTLTPATEQYLTWMSPSVSQVAYSSYKLFNACFRSYNSTYEHWASSVSTSSTYAYYVGQAEVGLKANSIPYGSMPSLNPTSSFTILNTLPKDRIPLCVEFQSVVVANNNMLVSISNFQYPQNYNNTPHDNGMRTILWYDKHVSVGYMAYEDPNYLTVQNQWEFTFPHNGAE